MNYKYNFAVDMIPINWCISSGSSRPGRMSGSPRWKQFVWLMT